MDLKRKLELKVHRFFNSGEMPRRCRSDQHHVVEQKVKTVTQISSAPHRFYNQDSNHGFEIGSVHLQCGYYNLECAVPVGKYRTATDIERIVAKCLKFPHCLIYIL